MFQILFLLGMVDNFRALFRPLHLYKNEQPHLPPEHPTLCRLGEVSMAHFGSQSALLSASTALLAALVLSGCLHGSHPDVKLAVYNSLDAHDLRSVTVSQDRDAGVITLSGIVGANDRKQIAEQLVQQAAPGYAIVDRIQVNSAGLEGEKNKARQTAHLDSAIEDHFKARLRTNPALKNQKIEYSAFDGTLTLKGSVNNAKEKDEAEAVAKRIPRVQHVVNEIQIHPGKPSPATS